VRGAISDDRPYRDHQMVLHRPVETAQVCGKFDSLAAKVVANAVSGSSIFGPFGTSFDILSPSRFSLTQ
jgi:hypothetical protein